MRESLRPLPPAYVRRDGDYSPPRNAVLVPFHRAEEDLPPYSRTDPLAGALKPVEPEVQTTEGRLGLSSASWETDVAGDRDWYPSRGSRIEVSEEEDDDDNGLARTRFRSRLEDSEEEDVDAITRNDQQEEPTQLARREAVLRIAAINASRDIEAACDSYPDNVEVMPSAKRRRNCGCQCSVICWVFWLFWVVVIAIAAGVAWAQTN